MDGSSWDALQRARRAFAATSPTSDVLMLATRRGSWASQRWKAGQEVMRIERELGLLACPTEWTDEEREADRRAEAIEIWGGL